MPFDLRGSPAAQRHARMAQYRRFKYPALFAITALAAVSLYEQSSLARFVGRVPSTNLGWQSYQAVYKARTGASSTGDNASEDAVDLGSGGTGQSGSSGSDYGDWWDDDYNDAYDGFAPEPTAEIWDPFILNSRPLVEITAKACIWPPSLYDTCTPESTVREDAEKGQWIRVEKDLNLRIGVYYLYLFYRRLPLYSSLPTIREFKLLTSSEESAAQLSLEDGWHKVTQDLRDGIWPKQDPIHLFYRTQSRVQGGFNSSDEINEIDVIWGSSGTLWGWNRMHRDFADPKDSNTLKDTDEGAELMWRKGAELAPQASFPLSFSSDGKYKIMQIADLHFSVAKGKCLDSNWPGCKDKIGSDNVTLEWLNEVLDEEKPDLVILSGDQLNGQDTSYSAESVILKVAHLFERRSTPWAAVLGNHDDEKTTLTRYGQFVMMQALPYFVGEPGPIDVDGEGNYVLKLYSADESRTVLFTLYFLDSHAGASSLNPFASPGYDWLKDSQINWFKNQSAAAKPIERPWSPPVLADDTFDVVNDLDGNKRQRLHRRRTQATKKRADTQATSLKKPNAMAIFHIPLPEVYDEQPDIDPKSKSPLVFGSEEKGRGAPKTNSGFFEKALVASTELGPAQAVDQQEVDDDPDYAAAMLNARPEVKVVLNGHCHTTDQCRRIKGVWNCFAGGASYSGYSKVGFDRRVRVYDLSDYGETITTYKIVDSHSDTSGLSDLSYPGAAETTSESTSSDSQARAGSRELKAGRSEEARTVRKLSRATADSTRHRIDEMVLVGSGAPGY